MRHFAGDPTRGADRLFEAGGSGLREGISELVENL
jgi:hypothetical protein